MTTTTLPPAASARPVDPYPQADAEGHHLFVERIPRKFWDTKHVRIATMHGPHTVMTYHRTPRDLRFASPMVNDRNQDFCGGWSPCVAPLNSEEVLVSRVLDGQKPLGVGHWILQSDGMEDPRYASHFAEHAASYERTLATVTRSGLPYYHQPPHRRAHWLYARIAVCQPGTFRDHFDLPTLVHDYATARPLRGHGEAMGANLRAFADQPFAAYLDADAWDPIPTEVLGLLLGYPIENTMSLLTR